MNLLNKYRWKYCNALLILSLTLQMFIVITPEVTVVNSGTSMIGNSGNVNYTPLPLKNNQRLYFITAFTGNESISEVESYLSIDRNSLGFRGFTLRFFKYLLPAAGLGVLVLCFGYVINKKEQHKSILTILLGGHAPPKHLPLLQLI